MHKQLHIPIPEGALSIEVAYKAKSSYPIVASPSCEGTIGAEIISPTYSQEQHETWKIMLKKQSQLVKDYLCKEYLEGMNLLNFPKEKIPSLSHSSESLKKSTGWQIIRAEGLVSPKYFFALLANKVFPCTDFIRHIEEIDYTPAPDTFHDQAGHLAMITNHRFAEFFNLFGIAGAQAKDDEEVMWFNRIYWFTVEFGLINPTAHAGRNRVDNQCRIYGAGIASSCGEIVYSLSDKVKKHPFSLDVISETDFDIHHMQDQLFEIESFDELESEFRNWAQKKGFI
ncbi:phenylalanine 4-monooxygenase [Fluviispira multicolorata]|uniref:Phenylalanine 4-monooxygenase n=2 Tax=Fluviispira multicolorata TaxID=2654512 RepID=A0A833JEA2_9BACT|nr:phenylalanine 4-monooxygenase [Fluviispira multicolorata]